MSMFKICTAQAIPFKATMDAIHHCHIAEANFVVNGSGVTMIQLDPAHALVLHMFLEKPAFQLFDLHEEEVIVGVSISTFCRLIKSVTNKDTITLCVDYDDPEYLKIVIYNDFSKTQIVHKMKILLLDYDKIEIPHREVDRVISMPSSEFAKYVKEFSQLNDIIEFNVEQDTFYIRTRGDLCISEAKITPKKNIRGENFGNGSISIGLGRNGHTQVCQEFNAKYLQCITKGSNLDDQITVYLTMNKPLLIRYNISIIGSLVYILAPHSHSKDDVEQK